MSKLTFTDLGQAEIKRMTEKAALVVFDEQPEVDEKWVPFSLMATPTAADCVEGHTIERFRVESWFAEKMGVES